MPSWFESFHEANVKPILNETFGVTVCLACGPLVTEPFTARRSIKKYETSSGQSDVFVETTIRKYLLPVASVVIDGEEIEPQRGWLVIEGGSEFEVIPDGNGEHAAELDSTGFDWIVNAKLRKVND